MNLKFRKELVARLPLAPYQFSGIFKNQLQMQQKLEMLRRQLKQGREYEHCMKKGCAEYLHLYKKWIDMISLFYFSTGADYRHVSERRID